MSLEKRGRPFCRRTDHSGMFEPTHDHKKGGEKNESGPFDVTLQDLPAVYRNDDKQEGRPEQGDDGSIKMK